MSALVRIIALMLALTAGALAQSDSESQPGAEPGADAGTRLYRSGDVDGAIAAWRGRLALTTDAPDAERARLAYNLGVAEHARGDALRAVGWFTAALEHSPRHADASFNLDLARADAGLDPKDGGTLAGTAKRYLTSWTRGESNVIAFLGVVLLALVLAGEALRGGAWKRAAIVAALVYPLSLVPLATHVFEASGSPVMVVDEAGADVRAVPLSTGERVGSLEAGDVVRRIDGLPGWSKIRYEGEERWVETEHLLSLRWPEPDAGSDAI